MSGDKTAMSGTNTAMSVAETAMSATDKALPVIAARNLHKTFGATRALDAVSFNIEAGSIVGLLGTNGAGKTTLLKALLGLTDCSGELRVLGLDPRRQRHQLMEKVGYIADVGILPRWMKVREALDFVAGVHPRFDRSRAETMLAQTDIMGSSRISELSKGMVTQLHLALILAIDVELLVLDEPTLGLDIRYQQHFFDTLLGDCSERGITVLISTHQVEEVKHVLSHLMLIHHGKLVLHSALDTLNSEFQQVEVAPEQQAAALALQPLYTRPLLGRTHMLFRKQPQDTLAALGRLSTPTLSDVFMACTQTA